MKLVGVLFEWKGGRGVCEMCEEKTFKDGRVDGVQLVRAKREEWASCGQTFEIK